MRFRPIITFVLCLLCIPAFSQEPIDTSSTIFISEKYFEAIDRKTKALSEDIDQKSKKTLARFKKHESKLLKRLAKVDSLAARNIFATTTDKYKALEENLKNRTRRLIQYIPQLDSLNTSLKFLGQNPEFLSKLEDAKEKLGKASAQLQEFQSKLQGAEDIKKFLKERREYLKQSLEQFGFAKELKKINKEVYYYSQQVKEIKELFKDPKRAERKALELLTRTKLFKDFMKKNSLLASLFPSISNPNDPSNMASFAGLQTRAQVNALIQNQVSTGGSNAQQIIRQNIQQAQSELQKLKDKMNKWGSGNSDDVMPDGFKPNNEKTKSFLQRLELGTNMQTQTARLMFPITSDLGLSLGYKLNQKSVLGVGASYKMGLGRGWNNIAISHQGIGIRSFMDWKIKGSFWISGGYEQNYKSAIRNVIELSDRSAWQKSGLIGISKVVSIRSKVFKRTKAQLLWDFLSYQQVPRTQAIIFRVGYNIK